MEPRSSVAGELFSYSFSDICLMGYSFILTKLFYPGALLVRRPISIRQKRAFKYGRGLSTGRNCRIEVFGQGEITMGESCSIGDNVHIVASERVEIGRDCLFASKIFISDTSHGAYGERGDDPDLPPNERALTSSPVFIGDRVWLGENVVVLPGVTIGSGCIIGSSAVVSRSIPDNCIAVGSPAQAIKFYDKEQGWIAIAH